MTPSIDLPIPDGTSGSWIIDTFTIDPQAAAMYNLRCVLNRTPQFRVDPGAYRRLSCNGRVVMTTTRMEQLTHQELIHHAHGRVLLNGLGLGMALALCLARPSVEHVTVVELAEDVIKLVGPSYTHNPRVTIVHADAFTYQPPPGTRYNAVWHDIWPTISADNLPDMHRLHRRYGRRADWQGSWARRLCEVARR